MKERPILFSAPMVRAILDGSKTQTRRVMKKQPRPGTERVSLLERAIRSMKEAPVLRAWFQEEGVNTSTELTCPYGKPGDRLWVRETCRGEELPSGLDGVRYLADDAFIQIKDDQRSAIDWLTLHTYRGGGGNLRVHPVPSIHMPRWASRILLEIVSVRVERLQDISEADACAEGVAPIPWPVCCGQPGTTDHGILGTETHCCGHPDYDALAVPAFQALWEGINGAESYAANPWVWVVEFKRVPA